METENLLDMMEMFGSLIVTIVSLEYTSDKTHTIVYFKLMYYKEYMNYTLEKSRII